MKRRYCISFLLLLVSLFALAGCSSKENSSDQTSKKSEKSYEIEVVQEVKDIKTRGYLLVGCKTDIPGLSEYNYKTKKYEGMEVDLAYCVAAKIFDVTYEEARQKELVKFIGVTVKDRFEQLDAQKVDCLMATVTDTKERRKKYLFSKSYHTDSIGMMMYSKGEEQSELSVPMTSISQLDGKVIGVPKNATTRKEFLSYIEMNHITVTPRFIEYEDYQTLFKALKSGAIDVFAADTSLLKGYQTADMTILNEKISSQKYAVTARKDCKALISVIDVVLEELDDKGKLHHTKIVPIMP